MKKIKKMKEEERRRKYWIFCFPEKLIFITRKSLKKEILFLKAKNFFSCHVIILYGFMSDENLYFRYLNWLLFVFYSVFICFPFSHRDSPYP